MEEGEGKEGEKQFFKKLESDGDTGQPSIDAPETQEEEPHAQTPPPDVRPLWKAMVRVNLGNKKILTLGDTGCTKSCISESFLRKYPLLYKRFFRPSSESARSIDGSGVVTVGIVNIKFKLGRKN